MGFGKIPEQIASNLPKIPYPRVKDHFFRVLGSDQLMWVSSCASFTTLTVCYQVGSWEISGSNNITQIRMPVLQAGIYDP